MRRITLLVFVALAVLLTYKQTPDYIYKEVKKDIVRKGYEFPYLWYEDIIFSTKIKTIGRSVYGMNPSMGAYASNITILINPIEWKKMNTTQRKLLVLHEIIHSIGGEKKFHCLDRSCIMSSGYIGKWKDKNYEEVLEHTMQHHDLFKQDRSIVFRF